MQKRKRSKNRPSKLSQLEHVNLDAAGIDVGADRHFVAVPEGRCEEMVRSFSAFTSDLRALADWLVACEITTVAMESTGIYWIPLYELLERRGFDVNLVDPSRLKNVPGRKTDVLDCQWIQQLHTYGLLSGAFRPDDQICVLRTLMRQRSMLIDYAARHLQHMQKALDLMNLKLRMVVRDVAGKTGLRIIRAIVSGEHDPQRLARLRDPRCKHSVNTIAEALHGTYRKDHLFSLQQALELYEVYQDKIRACDNEISAHLQTFQDKADVGELDDSTPSKKLKNAPAFDVTTQLYRISGADLTAIDGINEHTALKVVSEIGLDMNKWPTVKHFSSWLGLCPGSKISGGKVLSTRSKRSANRAAEALRLAAHGLHRSDSALGAFLRRKKAHLGAPKAITATAHKLARLVYYTLKRGINYNDPGADYYERRYRDRQMRNLKRRAKSLGYQLMPLDSSTSDEKPDYNAILEVS